MEWAKSLGLISLILLVNFSISHSEKNDTNSAKEETMPCINDQNCITSYTPEFQIAQGYNSTLVHEPTCQLPDDNSTSVGSCTCKPYCKSYSTTTDNIKFYYCGPCGRVGSECSNVTKCTHEMGYCRDGYCECKDHGTFYELYYCYIPYYGYEVALQLAIATCIIIAVCLIFVSIYNAIGVQRLRRMQTLRDLLRRDNGVRATLPNDTPPKYDDVVEDLPTYQDALKMDNQDFDEEKGVPNLAFEKEEQPEGVAKQVEDLTSNKTAAGSSEDVNKNDDLQQSFPEKDPSSAIVENDDVDSKTQTNNA